MTGGPDCAAFTWPIVLIAIWVYRYARGDRSSMSSSTRSTLRARRKPPVKPPVEEFEVDPGWDQASGRPRRRVPGLPPPPAADAPPPGSRSKSSAPPPSGRQLDPDDEW
ncbi:MAG: hypothetical protein ACREJ2_12200 [Planctomycetota bacterium]